MQHSGIFSDENRGKAYGVHVNHKRKLPLASYAGLEEHDRGNTSNLT